MDCDRAFCLVLTFVWYGIPRRSKRIFRFWEHGEETFVTERNAPIRALREDEPWPFTMRNANKFSLLAALAFVFLVCCMRLVAAQEPANKQSSGCPPSQCTAPSQDAPADEIIAVPNRPTFASTAESVQKGTFEIEYGFEATDGHQNINGLLKFGASNTLELWFLNLPLERDAGMAGVGDSGAGFKYRFLSQRKKLPSVALLYIASVPTATNNLGSGAVSHLAQFLVSRDFGKSHFDFNEGAQWLGRPQASGFDRRYFTALSYSHPLRGKWGITAELAGFGRANPETPSTMTLLAAATYNFSSRLVLDGGAYLAAYGPLPRVTSFAGLTYSVFRFDHRPKSRPGARR